MKKLTLILALSMTIIFIAGCDTLTKQTQLLDAPWTLKYDSARVGLRQGWFDNEYDRSNWETTQVPGVWADEQYDGFAWYSTQIQAKNIPAGYNLALVFDSIDDNAVVWLDGRLFGKQMGYNIKFYFDIGDKLADGKMHQLVLRIEDLGGPGGIPGAVYLQPYTDEVDLLRSEASKHQAPKSPDWVMNANIYEVFVRSHSADRSFKAVTADLDRIQALGIDLVWLMPIHPIGVKNHKFAPGSPYAVQNYYQVNPRFGNLDDFKALVDSTHRRGMHIILDMVLNHTAWDNPLIKEHPDWYTKNEAGEIVSPNTDWWDTADLDYDKPELRSWMMEMLGWWLQETGVDGFRFDVAELVPNDFWSEAKKYCQHINPEVFFLAEGAQPELHLNGHNMTYSWNIWQGITQLAQGNADPSEIKRSFDMEQFQYPQGALRMRFTENHDKDRSHKLIPDNDLNLTSWAFIALMKGNPLIYAGQEIGAKSNIDIHLDDRIDWKKGDRQLEKAMSTILKLRKTWIKPDSKFEIIIADNDRKIMAYKHGSLLVFFNFSETEFKFKGDGIEEVLMGNLPLDEEGHFTLSARHFAVVK
ncbi:MAG: hypothetical protein K9M55_00840 [Candidatus Marinimicrobia bacterium]|nr:hypothetical protein [Candidatus Neomarinimicrobiota bacterium]MCF7921223.1 hypothetical protein [Candidatus Neomarinimicrobiota bacterium]